MIKKEIYALNRRVYIFLKSYFMETTIQNEPLVSDSEQQNKEVIQETIKEENPKRTEKSDTAPFSNTVVVTVTIFLWPIAWGLLSYVSLRNLWKETAMYALITSLVLTVILSYVFMVPLAEVDVLWIVVQAPMALIFILFQNKAVKEWALQNPTVKYRNAPKDIGWVLLWFALFFVIAFIVALFVTPV